MLERAVALAQADGVDGPQRIDVPAKGTAAADDGGSLREPVAGIVPALQSGSLFGGATGVIVVDAQSLLKSEIDTIVELLQTADPSQASAVFVAAGTLPARIKKLLDGETISIRALSEKDAAAWLNSHAKEHGLRIEQAARTELLHTFGSNTSAMKRAIDQLAVAGTTITVDDVQDRFTSRPDEPLWFLGDAIVAGNQGEALRRLADFLHHQHPLVALAYLEGEVRKRSIAAVSDSFDEFATAAKVNKNSYATRKIWDGRTRANGEALGRCVKAIARADITLKTQPEATHRVTMERLTVAMSRWLSR